LFKSKFTREKAEVEELETIKRILPHCLNLKYFWSISTLATHSLTLSKLLSYQHSGWW